MPEILDRCVSHVMGKGHSESSAFAICRSSLGLKDDGSEDAMPMEMPDEEMQRKADAYMAEQGFNQPTLRKRMQLCRAIGPFKNGDQEGELTVDLFKQLIANQKKQPRQIPVYLSTGSPNPDHPEDLDERFADGWVEGLDLEEDWLVGDVKSHGQAALAVGNDMVRGASIGTVQGKTYDGKPMGQVLAHVILTNSPFVKGMNIAASRVQGGEPVAYHFTALSTEADMADKDPKKDAGSPGKDTAKPDDGGVTLTEKITALECLMQEKDGQIRDLTAANANLLEENKAFRERPDLALAQKKIDQLERHNLAEKVRRITGNMIRDRQINSEFLRGWYDHDSDEVVLAGFKNSQFAGKVDLLEYHRASVPKDPSRVYASGAPGGATDGELTAEERKVLQDANIDPEHFSRVRGAANFTEHKRRKAAAQKGA